MGEELRDRVRERYAEVARSVRSGSRAPDSEAPGVDWSGGYSPARLARIEKEFVREDG